MNAKIVDYDTLKAAYDCFCDEMIVDHPKHGRLYLSEGWGGSSVSGETYRWRHGAVAKVPADCTLETLDGEWNEITTIRQAIAAGYGDGDFRPLNWPGHMIAAMAQAARSAPIHRLG